MNAILAAKAVFFMSIVQANPRPDSADSPVFGIPLDHLVRSRFEGWGQSVDHDDSVSVYVGGLDTFFGDKSNRMLRCLENAEQLFSIDLTDSEPDEESEDEPQRNLSPIVLYGETGTGKTALALSLISRICPGSDLSSGGLNSENLKPICFAGSEFYRRYVAAMDRQTISEFRQRILSSPGILIDNIGQLEGKLATQRELVHLIDQLDRLGKPVVITMRSPPVEANHLIPQLLSRLGGGISLPVMPPGIDARRKIIGRLSEIHRTALEPEAAEWVAQRMAVSVPKLNHFFVQLKTELKSRNGGQPPTDKPVDMMTLGLVFQQDESTVDTMVLRIIDTVAEEFEMPTSVLCSNSRKQTIVMARGIAIWLLRTMLGISYHSIGTRFGGRDHTTILHAFQKYDALIKSESDDNEANASLRNLVRTLQLRLNDTFAGQMTLIP